MAPMCHDKNRVECFPGEAALSYLGVHTSNTQPWNSHEGIVRFMNK